MKCEELKTITPEVAKTLLELNVSNRGVSRRHVDLLAKEMTNGRWKVNGDTICLNGSRLVDGQHRLLAVVASGVTIQSLVVTEIPSDVFDTKDIGKRRSPGDTLSVLGNSNASRLAAQLGIIEAYYTSRADRQVSYSNAEIEYLAKKYPNAGLSIQTQIKGSSLVPPSVLDACHYLFSQKDPTLAGEFVCKVLKGANMEEQSPWYLLRERLVANSLSKSKLSKQYIMALCIKAWNATRTGKTIGTLRWRERGVNGAESFPVIE